MHKKRNLLGLMAFAVLALVAILSLHGCGDTIDGASPRALPSSFELKQRIFFKWTETFDVTANGENLGTVTKKMLSWTKTFVYDDNTGHPSATASVAAFSWGVQIDVVDGQGKKIGTIKEEIFSSLFKTWTTYRILDAAGNQVATSQKSEFFSTDFELTANDGHPVANIHRNAFNWAGDKWAVSIQDATVVDPRIAVVIAAFKTSADEDAKAKDDSKSSSQRKK